jgi:hypothetical protein
LHLIGGLSAAATGALRALLDSAHIQNLPGGMKLKGSRTTGETLQPSATEIVQIDAPPNVDDIRKVFMPWPFNGPSTVLFQLLGWLTESAKGVVSTAEEKIADASNNMPVGTTLALIEQGSKTFSAIHTRLHFAQADSLRVICRLNSKYLEERAQIKKFGKVIVTREDFFQSDDIVPVSDPNIFSETQRYAQTQAVQQMSADPSVPWNKIAIYRRMMSIMRIENPDELLPPQPEPVSADPDTEIIAAMSGQMVKALPQMDHMLHIQEQLSFILDPVFGAANPVIINPGFAVLMNDVMQHWQFFRMTLKQQSQQQAMTQFQTMIVQQISMQMGPIPPEQLQMVVQAQMQQAAMNPQMQQQLRMMAEQFYQQALQQMQPMIQKLQQADQLVKQKMPPPQLPPEVQAQVQIGQAEVQRKTQADQAKAQLEQSKLQIDQQSEMADQAREDAKLQFEQRMAQQAQQIEAIAKQLAQQVEIQKNEADNRQHQFTELLKNNEDNRTAMMMEQMRQEGLMQREQLAQQMKEYQTKIDTLANSIIENKRIEASIEQEKIRSKQSAPKKKEDN